MGTNECHVEVNRSRAAGNVQHSRIPYGFRAFRKAQLPNLMLLKCFADCLACSQKDFQWSAHHEKISLSITFKTPPAVVNSYQRDIKRPIYATETDRNLLNIYPGFPSSDSPSRRMYSKISLRLRMPTSRLSSSMTIRRCTRDFRIVSKMVSRRSSIEQVKIPGKSCQRQHYAYFSKGTAYHL